MATLTEPSASASLADKQQYAVDYLQEKGWTRAQAIGLVANFTRESNLNPSITGDNGQAVGIAQWHPDRQAAFETEYGFNIEDATLTQQLDFVDFELKNAERRAGTKLSNTNSASECAKIVSQYYERPADTEGEKTRRGDIATELEQSLSQNQTQQTQQLEQEQQTRQAGGMHR